MKKNSLPIIVFIFFIICYFRVEAQKSQNLNSNSISTIINSNGQLFNDNSGGTLKAGFEIMGEKLSTAIFQSNLWLAARDKNDSLMVSADMYSGNDFFHGTYRKTGISAVNTMIKISKSAIDHHRLNYKSVGYVIPASISTWPANGDTSIGESLDLAPFVDVNGDGCYQPEKGDYPFIKGDEAVYLILNDIDGVHTSSTGNPIGLEIHLMAYYFNNSTTTDEGASIFIDYELRNRSNNRLDSLFIGQFVDFDLGCSDDDYFGSDSSKNLMYVYNGDRNDEDCRGVTGFGDRPPSVATGYYNQSLSAVMAFNRTGVLAMQDPQSPIEIRNYLNAIWRDGSPLWKGGSGHSSDWNAVSTGKTTRFAYSGDPITSTGWTEGNASNIPGDRRGVMAMPVRTLEKNGRFSFTVIFSYGYESNSAQRHPLNIDLVKSSIEGSRNFLDQQTWPKKTYATQFCAPLTIGHNIQEKGSVSLFPNPATTRFQLSGSMTIKLIEVYSVEGKLIFNQNVKVESDQIGIDLPKNIKRGVYLVHWQDSAGNMGVEKLFVQ